MQRSRSALLLRYTMAAVVAATVVLQDPAAADRSLKAENLPYTVKFGDWSLVYLTTMYATVSPDYYVLVGKEVINGKVRYTVTGRYKSTAIGLSWFRDYGSKLRDRISVDCKRWTLQGHEISLNDFTFDISQWGH